MKKIGLAVVTYVNNFGSFLQSFATFEIIKRLGFEPEVINIDRLKNDIGKRRRRYFAKRLFNYEELRSYFVTLRGVVRLKTDRKYREQVSIRNAVFDAFRKDNFVFSTPFSDWKELSAYCQNNYDSVLVGSDQLWRPANIEGDFYTLNFVPDTVNKVAYATSFGVSVLPKAQSKKAGIFLERINHLSTREQSGQDIILQLINRKAEIVCDPTMLLAKEDWEKYLENKNKVSGDYILCYFLGSNEKYLKFSKKLKEKTGLKTVGLVHCAGFNSKVDLYMDETPFDIDPFDFVSLAKNAKYVLTDSFHCCVFSILMERPFFAFRRFSDKDKMSTNNRLFTLFRNVGLEDRLLTGDENIEEVIKRQINYKDVAIELSKNREQSLVYLKKSLGIE